MRWLWITLIIVLIVFGGGYFLLKTSAPPNEFTLVSPNNTAIMTLKSPVFSHNGNIPPSYTCDGDDINPPLTFEDVPTETQSLALVVHDPDAPADNGWTHWLVWNMDPAIREISEDSVPDGAVEGTTDFNEPGYGGPCPPSGTHHYNFTLYALDTQLDLDENADRSALEEAMDGHIIKEATLTGLYSSE